MSNAHHSAHDTADGHGHGTVKSYVIGFILSIILTVIPFWMVMDGSMSNTTIAVSILIMAVAQVIVQLVFFLHMDGSASQRGNVLAFLFAVKVMFIVVGGSIWVMVNMRYFMGH